MLCFFIFVFLIPILDFSAKFLVRNSVPESLMVKTFLPFLEITYVKNFGAAFSMFCGGRYFFIVTSVLAILSILYIVFIKKTRNKLFLLAASFVVGGGIGNLIDRIFWGYVVDYLKLSFFGPVCNISDYFITFGAILFIIYFLNKKED